MVLEDTAKTEALLGLAALLSAAASNAGYSHAAWTAGRTCRKVGGATLRPSLWEGIDFDFKGSPAGSLAQHRPPWRPRGIRVLVSDLFWPEDPVTVLRALMDRAALAVVIQLLGKADMNPPERGNIRLVDTETGEELDCFVDAAVEKRYKDALARHQQNWHRTARQVGALMTTLVAERIVTDWNLEALMALEILKTAS
jgi:uncharacterized protein (DUF58 family)